MQNQNETNFFKIEKQTEKKLRTDRQNRYYWWVVVPIITDYSWHTPLEVNYQNKILFWKKTFTDLSTVEFEVYMSLIRQFYNFHYNLNIPKPNEDLYYYD